MDNETTIFEEFNSLVDETLEDLFKNQKPKNLLFHYTSTVALEKILNEKKLRFTHYQDLNDSSELIYAIDKLSEKIQPQLNKTFRDNLDSTETPLKINECCIELIEKPENSTYLFSFCNQGNHYPAWRFYADEGFGVSIGFKFESLSKIAIESREQKELGENDFHVNLTEVMYNEDYVKQKISTRISNFINKKSDAIKKSPENTKIKLFARIASFLNAISPIIKHPAYESEKEWRLISMMGVPESLLDTQNFIRYAKLLSFKPDDIETIYFGPCMSKDKQRQIRTWLNANGYEKVETKESGIPYRGK